MTTALISVEALNRLIALLKERGFEVVGPTIRDGAILYDSVDNIEDLPRGWTAEQSPGRYRLKQRDDNALFGFGATVQGLKRFLHPPEMCLFRADRSDGEFTILDDESTPPKYAFLGVHACDLAAMERQDRVLIDDRYADPIYRSRRRNSFFVAVNCTDPSGNCFCESMGTGPQVSGGFDILLTELPDGLLAESGSDLGEEILQELPGSPATQPARVPVQMKKSLRTEGLARSLNDSFDHPAWDDVAARCLMCANCTMSCPTCFCVSVEDSSDVSQHHAERWRRWDSCFTQSFSYIHGGSVRMSPKSRYRQWLTHKFAAWIDQFGTSGCVGCGRCTTWCPAGIDIVEQLTALSR